MALRGGENGLGRHRLLANRLPTVEAAEDVPFQRFTKVASPRLEATAAGQSPGQTSLFELIPLPSVNSMSAVVNTTSPLRLSGAQLSHCQCISAFSSISLSSTFLYSEAILRQEYPKPLSRAYLEASASGLREQETPKQKSPHRQRGGGGCRRAGF